jgi:hypothetical protein
MVGGGHPLAYWLGVVAPKLLQIAITLIYCPSLTGFVGFFSAART